MLGWRTRTNLGRTVWFHFFTFLSPSALMIASKWQGWLVPDMPTQLLRGCIWHHQAWPARIGSGHPQLKSAEKVRWRCLMAKELFKMHTHLYLSSYIYILTQWSHQRLAAWEVTSGFTVGFFEDAIWSSMQLALLCFLVARLQRGKLHAKTPHWL